MADNAKWYVAHTYSGYENAVKTAIEKFVANRHLEDMILDIQIPLETVTEVTDSGDMKEVERKVFPGYVLVKMIMTDDTWHLIRNIRGVSWRSAWNGERSSCATMSAIRSRSPTARFRPSSARSKRSTQRRTRCAWSCPCSDAKRRSSWSSIRSRS